MSVAPSRRERGRSRAARNHSKSQLARDVISLAFSGGMPDSFWHTDQRIARACDTLGWTVYEAQLWAAENPDAAPRRV